MPPLARSSLGASKFNVAIASRHFNSHLDWPWIQPIETVVMKLFKIEANDADDSIPFLSGRAFC